MSDLIEPSDTPDEIIKRIRLALGAAAQELLEAGRLYAGAIDRYGEDFRERVLVSLPEVPREVWRKLESVGRGALDPRLMYAVSEGARRLRRLPPHEQARALDGKVEVLAADGSHFLVEVANLTRFQCDQVFAIDHIRDLGEQRTWREEQAVREAPPPQRGPAWRVRGDVVEVLRPTALTAEDLRTALRQLRGK